jgi:hypothetical protein
VTDRRPPSRRGTEARGAAVAIGRALSAGLLLAGCAATTSPTGQPRGTDLVPATVTLPSESAPATGLTPPTGADTPDKSGPTRSTPPLPTGDFPDAAAPKAGTACQPSQLRLVAGGTDAAAMYRQFAVTATNTGASACQLAGFASVIFRGTEGSTFWVAERHDLMQGPATPAPVALDPDGSATVLIGWSGVGAVHGLEQAGEMLMTVSKGSAPAPVQLDPQTLPIDIVDGGTVRIGEWRTAATK